MPGVNRIIWGVEGSGQFYGFDDMIGALQRRQNALQPIVRLGVDDVRIRETGVRAKPSQVITQLWVDDENDAKLLLDNDYLPLKDGNAYEVKQYGESMGYFKVLDVVEQPMQPAGAVRGHIGGGTPTILQTIAWTLIHVATPP